MERPEIVISGVSGRFPNCASVDQLRYNVYNEIEMITENEERWPRGTYGLPLKSGVLRDTQNFDAPFFGLTHEEADQIDPTTRINIETTFEALCDAGLNPWDLGSRKAALFMAQGFNEMGRYEKSNGIETVSRPQLMERLVAFIFNIRHGVYLLESACSSSLTAINEAFTQLSSGYIDLAIVSCCNILWCPATALLFHRLGLTVQNGYCHFLDSQAAGYVRGETVGTLILERAQDAQRYHAQLVYSMINCDGYKDQGITHPKWEAQAALMARCYSQSNIDQSQIDYFECHGTGTEVGDQTEVQAIWSFFGDKRSKSKPLLLGSVKTNLGHCEQGSGFSSLLKCLFIFKSNLIPPNLHFHDPSPLIPELLQGFVEPVRKLTPFHGEHIPINNFGFGGSNGHLIVGKGSKLFKEPIEGQSMEDKEKPIIFLCCGRNETSINTMIDGIKSMKSDQLTGHFAALVNRYTHIMSNTPNGSQFMKYRGFVVSLPSANEKKVSSIVELSSSRKPTLCFVFPGAGCQIKNCVKPFMKLKPFRESIEESVSILDPDGDLGIRGKLLAPSNSCWEMFSLTVFQVAVVDTLKTLGVTPDLIVGHSIGQFSCGYVDSFLSKAEFLDILYCFFKGIDLLVTKTEKFQTWSMLAVEMTRDQLDSLVPSDLEVSCYNASDCFTLSGLTEHIEAFAALLKDQGIFHRRVDSFGCAFHSSKFDQQVSLRKLLSEQINHFANIYRRKTDRWILSHKSTMNVDGPLSLRDFWIESVINVVTFDEACKSIPKDAVCIEISPRRYLTSSIKRNLTQSSIVEVPFRVPKSSDSHHQDRQLNQIHEDFLTSLGNLYVNGLPINLDPFYGHQTTGLAPIETPFLSPLIKLDHSSPHLVRKFPESFNFSSKEKVLIDVTKKHQQYLGCFHYKGHRAIPISYLIHSVWSRFAMLSAQKAENLAVRFEKVKVHRLPFFDHTSTQLSYNVNFVPIPGDKYNFLITAPSNGSIFMKGTVSAFHESPSSDLKVNRVQRDSVTDDRCAQSINGNNFYAILSRTGLHYSSDLRNMINVNGNQMSGIMRNNLNWICEAESLLQLVSFLNINSNDHDNSYLNDPNSPNTPVLFDEIHCIPLESSSLPNLKRLSSTPSSPSSSEPSALGVRVFYETSSDTISSSSVSMRGIQFGSFETPGTTQLGLVDVNIETFVPRFNIGTIQPRQICISIITDQLIDLLDLSHGESGSLTIHTCQTVTNHGKGNQSLPGLIEKSLIQRNDRILSTVIEIDSLHQLTNGDTKVNPAEMIPSSPSPPPLTTTTSSPETRHLLILEADKSSLNRLFGHQMKPSSTQTTFTKSLASTRTISSNIEFLIVEETIEINDHNNPHHHPDNDINRDNNRDLNRNKLPLEHVPSGFVIVSYHLSDQGYIYLSRRSIESPDTITTSRTFNVNKVATSIESLVNINSTIPSINPQKVNNRLDRLYLMVINLLSSTGLIDSVEIPESVAKLSPSRSLQHGNGPGRKPRLRTKVKWMAIDDESYKSIDRDHLNNQLIEMGLTYTGIRDKVPGSFHYLPFKGSPEVRNTEMGSIKEKVFLDRLLASLPPNYTSIALSFATFTSLPLIGFAAHAEGQSTHLGIIEFNPSDSNFSMLNSWSHENLQWTLEEASTIPLSYYLAYYVMNIIARLQSNETVLILNGHSSIGSSLICLGLNMGCTVYTSVESEEQKTRLQRRFPSLTEKQFLIKVNSEMIEQTIKISTNGYGFDLIVNTISDITYPTRNDTKINTLNNIYCAHYQPQLYHQRPPQANVINLPKTTADKVNLESILNCLSVGGRCIDLNRSPMLDNDNLGLSVFLNNITYYSATAEGLFQAIKSTVNSKRKDDDHNNNNNTNPEDDKVNPDSGVLSSLPSTMGTQNVTQKIPQSIANYLSQGIQNGIVCPPVNIETANIIRINLEEPRNHHSKYPVKLDKSFVNIIIGYPGDIELEIIEKSRTYDGVTNYLIIPNVPGSTDYLKVTCSPVLAARPQTSRSSAPWITSFQTPFSPSSARFLSSSSLTPMSSTSNLHHHLCLSNQLPSLGCSFVNMEEDSPRDSSSDKPIEEIISQYEHLLKDISSRYVINKVFIVYRSNFNEETQILTHGPNQRNPPHPRFHPQDRQFGDQLTVKLLDYLINSTEISINFLILISCSLSQDSSFIWPQLVRKCQPCDGKQPAVPGLTVELADLLPPSDPHYWSQLNQLTEMLFTLLIGISSSTNEGENDYVISNKLDTNGVYRLTCPKSCT